MNILLVTFGTYIPLFGTTEGSASPAKYGLEIVEIKGMPFLKVTKDGFDFDEFVNFANIKGLRIEQNKGTNKVKPGSTLRGSKAQGGKQPDKN